MSNQTKEPVFPTEVLDQAEKLKSITDKILENLKSIDEISDKALLQFEDTELTNLQTVSDEFIRLKCVELSKDHHGPLLGMAEGIFQYIKTGKTN